MVQLEYKQKNIGTVWLEKLVWANLRDALATHPTSSNTLSSLRTVIRTKSSDIRMVVSGAHLGLYEHRTYHMSTDVTFEFECQSSPGHVEKQHTLFGPWYGGCPGLLLFPPLAVG